MDLPSDFHNRTLAQQRQWIRDTFRAPDADTDFLHGEYLGRLILLPGGYCSWPQTSQRAWWYWAAEAYADDTRLPRTEPEGIAQIMAAHACRTPERFEDEAGYADTRSPVLDFRDDMALFGGSAAFIAWKRAHPNTRVAEYVGQEAGAAIGAAIGGGTRASGQMLAESRAPTPTRRTRRAVGPRRVRRRPRPTRIDLTRPRGSQIVTASYTVPQQAPQSAAAGMPMWPIYVGASVAALALGYVAYRAVTRNTTRHPSGRRDDSIGVRDLRTGRALRI